MIKKILGFDVSSTTTAYCLLTLNEQTKEIKFVSADYLKPIKDGSILERLLDTRDKIQEIIQKIKPDYIGIEDILMFVRNKSTAHTVITLASFNRMIGLVAFDYLKRAPEMFGVLAMRHGLKLTPKFPEKEEMPEIVAEHLNIKFPWEYNKKGNKKVENYDKADAICVALFHAYCLTGKCAVKDKIPKKKKSLIKAKVSKKTKKAKKKK